MKFSTTIATALLLATGLFAGRLTAQRTPDEALRALQEGNRRFATERPQLQPLGEGVRRTLARGESPFAIVVCCSDSQVPPEHLFNTGLGELYVVRTAGHTIDAETIAGLEHAVADLAVPLCVVLGHEGCTAITHSIAQVQAPTQQRAGSDALQQLLEQIEPSVRKARHRDLGGKLLQDASEEEHAHGTVAECLRRSAVLRRYAAVGKFKIVAARCHQQSGEVEFLPIRPLPAEPEAERLAPHGAVPTGTPPHVALRLLQAGHRRFLGDGKPTADLSQARRQALAEAQTPPVIVLTCADSRVVPEHLFDAGLGELVVVRSPGNTLTDNALASIEQAATTFGSSLLVVLGHEQCDVIATATGAEGRTDLSPSMRHLLQRIEPSVAKARANGAGRNLTSATAALHAERMVGEARSRSPILRDLEQSGRFAMLASVYDLKSGDITWVKDSAPRAPTAAAGGGHGSEAPHGHGAMQGHGAGDKPTAKAGGHAAGKPKAKGKPREAHDLPVVDWDAPAAPAGETVPAHGGHAPATGHGDEHGHGQGHGAAGHEPPASQPHGAADDHGHAAPHQAAESHGSPAHGTGSHGAQAQSAPAHGEEPHGAAPSGHGHDDDHHGGDAHGAAPHGDAAHGASEHGASAPGGHGDAGHAPHDAHAAHGATAEHGAHDDHGAAHGAAPHKDVSWKDPIVLVGITGVVSLLAAAMLALRR
ncbi:MAG: carbonic anhydrase [Planctomycetota bacterium]|jgi:carbonic anhydrase